MQKSVVSSAYIGMDTLDKFYEWLYEPTREEMSTMLLFISKLQTNARLRMDKNADIFKSSYEALERIQDAYLKEHNALKTKDERDRLDQEFLEFIKTYQKLDKRAESG